MDALIGVVALFAIPFALFFWIPFQVHELGHFAGALLTGARFDYLPLGPLLVSHDASGRRLRLRIVRYPCGAVLPRSTRQAVIATAAGPLANFAIGAGAMTAAIFVTMPGATTQLAVFGAGFLVAAQGLAYVIPAAPYATPNDGRRLLEWMRDSASWRRWIALCRITRSAQDGTRPRDWNQRDVAALVQSSDGSIDDVAGALTLHWHLLDQGRTPDAENCLRQAVAAAGQRHLHEANAKVVGLELAYLEARRGADPSVAAAQLWTSAYFSRAMLLRVIAAIQLRYGEFAGALRTIANARTDLEGLRSGFVALETDLLDELESEAKLRSEGRSVAQVVEPRGPTPGIDVSLYASTSVRNPAQAKRGPFWARSAVGLTSASVLGLCVYSIVGAAKPAASGLVAVIAVVLAAAVVLRVGFRERKRDSRGLRAALAAAAVVAFSSSVVVDSILRLYSGPYLWFVGEARPCLTLDGPGFSSVVVYLLGSGFAFVGLVIGTRAERDRAIPTEGLLLGGIVVVLVTLVFSTDPSRLAFLVGCRTSP